jgi:hypothetical protein
MKQPTLHYEQKDSAVELVQFFIPKIHHTHAFSDVGGVLVGRLAIKNVTPPWLSIFAGVRKETLGSERCLSTLVSSGAREVELVNKCVSVLCVVVSPRMYALAFKLARRVLQ